MIQKLPEIVAAVDLGSNSFHMIVCSLKDGKLQTIDRLKEMVRLASGLDKHNRLDDETQERALACLERFGQRVRNFSAGSVRIVGTNTLRMAKNSNEFILKAEKALGHPIHIIAGIEEARLIYQGVANSLSSNAKMRFVMDIGGGSTEYIIGSDDVPKTKESLNMGCVTVSNKFFKEGEISKKAFTQAIIFAEHHLEPHQNRFSYLQWDEAIGASGSLKAISKVLEEKEWSNNGITLEGLEKLVDHITDCKHIDELKLPELSDERLPVFVGGVVIIYTTFKTLGIKQMTVSDGALREGLIHDLLGRIYDHDTRSKTVDTLASHYHTDKNHAVRVKHTVQHILRQIDPSVTQEDRKAAAQFLDWAAELHEIGHDIAHSSYHKHSAYIIQNADLAGFSKQDQILLATIVRLHRKKFSLSRCKELPAPWNRSSPLLTIILRLAVVLHRNRHMLELPSFEISSHKKHISIVFPEGWLEKSPLTYADLKIEADYLEGGGFKLDCR
ncbi:MAG: exopolyphosphatase [Methylococcaceae bacterium]|nr:exopolyphosphatase [Methylococcaceae bacterium]